MSSGMSVFFIQNFWGAKRDFKAGKKNAMPSHGARVLRSINPRSRGRAVSAHTPQAQLPLESPTPPPPDPRLLELEAALRAVSADDLTPRAALDLVYKLRVLLN